MMQSEFDKRVAYTLRIQLSNGRVILYPIDSKTKDRLTASLRSNFVDSNENWKQTVFVIFETSLDRLVIINTNSFIGITFCFDFKDLIDNPHAYRDNFNIVEKDVEIEETKIEGNESRLFVSETLLLPQLIIYHMGLGSKDNYTRNPQTFSELNIGCLGQLDLELDGRKPLRQFIELMDNNGEVTFIPIAQIIVMEFDRKLLGK